MNDAIHASNCTYLTFRLNDELFGLNINLVREVLEYTRITKVPLTAPYIRGVINVRGSVVPVVDLRRKFGLAGNGQTVDTCIIIVEFDMDGQASTMGALVDGVQEVLYIPPDQIEPPPRMGGRVNAPYIQGIGKLLDQFVILMDMQAIFSQEELCDLADMQQTEETLGA